MAILKTHKILSNQTSANLEIMWHIWAMDKIKDIVIFTPMWHISSSLTKLMLN